MPFADVSIIPGTGAIMTQDLDLAIRQQLKQDAEFCASGLKDLVQEKTPVLTGALQSDVTYDTYADPEDNDICWITTAGVEQLIAWDRIYVEYQEGGPMGLATYTNDPRLMFLRTSQTDGQAFVEAWATIQIQYALMLCAMGSGPTI